MLLDGTVGRCLETYRDQSDGSIDALLKETLIDATVTTNSWPPSSKRSRLRVAIRFLLVWWACPSR